ncbi:hypothetical protein LK07_12295 [Streptomyces pluripotens]|uniref:Proteinase inhibitor I42 chagasin domain-containing protein n=1 Tax=Streptomyces pluripotens TaxID=1355015 RepID=A0A221NXJ3_9ACTN|nr:MULTISPECIES: hypothetical protein [Streptomyces]ARP70431.1 hypothetical protein LK06_011175 [Streptomyces pluripotens]ASN24687.1 hypothetical protein LK07_12295 [Streptomyces pluripotens]KIE24951.1 hypothetical protein LK08_21800 [Streptomyces sp. MUSC 125]MCH0558825.1 hypothetical protein [Streptomyces sp. MUM 16J]
MRRTTITALAGAALLLTGCGSQSGGDTGSGGEVSPSTSAHSSPGPSRGCSVHGQLTAADSGRTVCLSKGDEVRIVLDGTKARPWKPVTASGSALQAINAGFVLQPGDATAAYRAVAAGTVKLTSSRPLCAQPSSPGQVSCKGIQTWTITVRVS